jgi:hypothetical protein
MALRLPKAFWPVTISAGVNDALDFVWASVTRYGTIAPATYYSVYDLVAAVQAAMVAAGATTVVVSVTATGRVTWTIPSGTLTLLWSTGAHAGTQPRALLGADAADQVLTGAASWSAPHQHQHGWYAEDPVQDDTLDLPVHHRTQTRTLGGAVKSLHFASFAERQIVLANLPGYKTWKVDEPGAHYNEALERLFEHPAWARLRWWSDAGLASEFDYADYALSLEGAKIFPRKRLSPSVARYSVTLQLLRYG